MKKKLPYQNGTWFAVPLRNGGFGTVVVASHSPDGVILVYLFGPKRSQAARLADLEGLTKADAIKVSIAGDLGLIEGSWPNKVPRVQMYATPNHSQTMDAVALQDCQLRMLPENPSPTRNTPSILVLPAAAWTASVSSLAVMAAFGTPMTTFRRGGGSNENCA
jgi:hypothetical protein